MVFHLDQSVRISGVGDLGAGRKMKAMGQAFYGRSKAYEAALEAPAAAELEQALARNIFGSCRDTGSAGPSDSVLKGLDRYLRANVAALESESVADLLAGRVRFEDPASPADLDTARSEAQHG